MAAPFRCALVFLGLSALSMPGRAAGPWIVRVEGGTTNYSSRTFNGVLLGYSELSLDSGKGFWVDYQIDVNGPPDREAEAAYGAKIGLDLAVGNSPWSVGASYRYMDVQHDGVEHDQYTGIHLNLISASVSYRVGGRR